MLHITFQFAFCSEREDDSQRYMSFPILQFKALQHGLQEKYIQAIYKLLFKQCVRCSLTKFLA